MQNDIGVAAGKLLDERRKDCRHSLRASDPHFPDRGVCEELNLLDGLLEIIKSCGTALEQRVAVDGRLYTVGPAIEQSDAKRMLQVGDYL